LIVADNGGEVQVAAFPESCQTKVDQQHLYLPQNQVDFRYEFDKIAPSPHFYYFGCFKPYSLWLD